jgi:DNA modification methylase
MDECHNLIVQGDSLDLIQAFTGQPDLIVTDPPYAFGNQGTDEHEMSATVAVVLREAAIKLRKGRWMLVMCASSWRSTSYMVEAVRGVVQPVRIATWCKPTARTKARTAGWLWASVNVVAFKKGKADESEPINLLDHITALPVTNGRRAELPANVADWLVAPYSVKGGLLLDPFAGSGAIVAAGMRAGMNAVGFEKNPPANTWGEAMLTTPPPDLFELSEARP